MASVIEKTDSRHPEHPAYPKEIVEQPKVPKRKSKKVDSENLEAEIQAAEENAETT